MPLCSSRTASFLSMLVLTSSICAENKVLFSSEENQHLATVQKITGEIDRASFNRIAAELYLPLFWEQSKEGSDTITPENVHILWGIKNNSRTDWIKDNQFTEQFYNAYQQVINVFENGHDDGEVSGEEQQRRSVVRQELSMGLPTLVYTDLTQLKTGEKVMVEHLLSAAESIEKIYALQKGSAAFSDAIQKEDASSQMMFYRNQGPWCEAPVSSEKPNCHAFSTKPAKISGLYPQSIQTEGFCDSLAQRDNAKELMNPFTVVVQNEGQLFAQPYDVAYRNLMNEVSTELSAAALAIDDESEQSLKHYLLEASRSFLNNTWQPADEAWAKMNADNSKWYLRVAPDEVYFEPCSEKAGFHLDFARINVDSKIWQERLDPLKGEMEETLADLAGPPYEARQVSFHLPDFIDVILNSGDSRTAHGATIGQSLPNWGPVANEGRGRTVAMTNLYTDKDSINNLRSQAQSLLCSASMSDYTDDSSPKTMSVVLHEAAHNLGPAHEYTVDGKTAGEIFGGPLASMLEELKAQSAALYYTDWLVEKGVINKEYAKKAHTADIVWTFGHISRGMYAEDGKPNTYSQLSAVQLGYLLASGAIEWRADELAANGSDKGCFLIKQDKLPEAIDSLIKKVAGIKARGDKPAAEELKQSYIDQSGETQEMMQRIANRWLRQPKASFIYSIRLS